MTIDRVAVEDARRRYVAGEIDLPAFEAVVEEALESAEPSGDDPDPSEVPAMRGEVEIVESAHDGEVIGGL